MKAIAFFRWHLENVCELNGCNVSFLVLSNTAEMSHLFNENINFNIWACFNIGNFCVSYSCHYCFDIQNDYCCRVLVILYLLLVVSITIPKAQTWMKTV